jgi:1-acyl-sn-glycerol-3-phosphate acyltransferase
MSGYSRRQSAAALAQRRQDRAALGMGLVVLAITSVTALAMLLAALLTLFRARRYYIEVVGRGFALALLWLCGVHLTVHRNRPWPTRQTVYISNHSSALDVFVLIALGLPNTRFFLSGFLRALYPLRVMGDLAGTFWTMPQTRPQERVRLFQHADEVLRASGESVFLSPEGTRVQTGSIGPFNKGAFHLAGSLGAPLLPLYLAVPLPHNASMLPADNPASYTVQGNLMSYLRDLRPCDVHVYVDVPIATRNWRLEDLDRHRQQVWQHFLTLHAKWKGR